MGIAVAGGTGLLGRHVVRQAERRGHTVIVLSRSRGADVRSGAGLADALDGVDTVIDVTNVGTTEEHPATDFFVEVAGTIQRVGAERGVKHVVTLSIVGIDRVPFGYYAAKLAQERAAASGSVPSTILRATQFHEFAGKAIARGRDGAAAHVMNLRVQTVAARTVAAVLVDLAEGAATGRAPDLAGPEEADLVTLARRLVQRRGKSIQIHPDDDSVAAIPPHAFLPGPGARIEGPTFDEWLDSEDAAALAL